MTRAATWVCECGLENRWDRITCRGCGAMDRVDTDATEAGAQLVIPGAEARNVAKKPQRGADDLPLFGGTKP